MKNGEWLNWHEGCRDDADGVEIGTAPRTDMWQRTYYGFRVSNAPCFLWTREEDFSITCRVDFQYEQRFDQCGLVLIINDENWFKVSTEYENERYSRLGSVVTNGGYSDWATRDVSTPRTIWYRLSRRGPDFLAESSADGSEFAQTRVFHMHMLGTTTKAMARMEPGAILSAPVRFGVYACSPLDSSFVARFSSISAGPSYWEPHRE